jgi:uncharacterized protein
LANTSFHLYQLQKIDLQIDHANQQIKKINDLLKNNAALNAAQEKLNQIKAFHEQKTAELLQVEASARNKQIKIEQSESAMYKGNISNPKELKDLQNEIASLKKILGQIEENQFQLMSDLETLDENLKKVEAEYSTVLTECEITNQGYFQQIETLKKETERASAERAVTFGQLQPEHIAIYEKLRNSKNHIAVTKVEDESCSTCGSEISASDIQKARGSASLLFCPSCGRILYAG